MASRVELFTVTTPAGTAITAPLTTATTFDPGEVEALEILVPPGNAGLSGFQVRHSNAGVFPREDSKWIIASGEVIKWLVQDAPTAGRWQFRTYNTDANDHSLYVRFLVRENDATPALPMPPLDIQQPDQEAPSIEDAPEPPDVPEE